jgi:hypothetical protein
MSDELINEKEDLKESQPAEEAKPYNVIIEEARKELHKNYSTSRRISNILMFVVLAAIVGIMFLIISNNQVLKIVGYSLAGALVVGMVVYYIINRKKLPNKIRDYVPFVMKTLNQQMFSRQGFSELKNDPEEKLAMDDLIGDAVYKDATGINSRNIIRGVYKGHHFLCAEAALTRPSSRKQQVPPLFVGRYISVPNQMKFDGRFIFAFKNPKSPVDLPNNIDDLVVLEDKEELTVYGLEGANYHDIIDNKILSQLKKLQIEGHLLNVNAVFWGGHTAVYLSYDDAILSVPFEKEFDKAAFEQTIVDLDICLDAITEE